MQADGTRIVDGAKENFIIRSIGTGNWLLMEGYMMQSTGIAGTHTDFRNKLIETIGVANTDSFYTKWKHDHMQKVDVDSLAAWGYNTIRVAMHYKWFTLPIENEPVAGVHTWLEPGFAQIDTLLEWCKANSTYLILDMHGAPGGQGANADISDYDPDLPSLWESNANKAKLVAIWYKLAERYAEEEWIGGYDLINETNWTFPEGNNSQLKNIYKRITDSIRLVDQNHILFIEGNSYANDHSLLTPPWDDNLVYSFHKYWDYNTENSLDWILSLRDEHDVPLWCGETGENSNTWFTNMVRLSEANNVGWSFWPVKKVNVNNPLRVVINQDYDDLIKSWKGEGPDLSTEDAFQAVLKFADNHKFENCVIQYDVIDAIFRQPYTTDLISKYTYVTEDTIFAVNYAMGRVGYAYFDTDTADYHGSTGEFTNWNNNYAYRNDGVDIETSGDLEASQPFSVGWVNNDEWLVYLFHNDSTTKFDCVVRSASDGNGGNIVFEADGKVISDEYDLPGTGGWYAWESTTFEDVVLPEGEIKLKIRFTKSGSNLNFLKFTNPRTAKDVEFTSLLCETSTTYDNKVFIHVNRDITAEDISVSDFSLYAGTRELQIESAGVSEASNRVIIIRSADFILNTDAIKVSYTGSSIHNGIDDLVNFEQKAVRNRFAAHTNIPMKIQAEDFYFNNGFRLEDCEDLGGGKNTAYANSGDYLDYLIRVTESKEYQIDFRFASLYSNSQIYLEYEVDDVFIPLKTVSFPGTSGWQNWETQSELVNLVEGKYIFRIKVKQGEHNLNWIQFKLPSDISPLDTESKISIYPNPAGEYVNIEFPGLEVMKRTVELYHMNGSLIWKGKTYDPSLLLGVANLKNGTYFLKIREANDINYHKLIVN